jgi:hypothetical protein
MLAAPFAATGHRPNRKIPHVRPPGFWLSAGFKEQPANPGPSQAIEVELARLQSEKDAKILDFHFSLRHRLADPLQVVNIFNGIDFLDLLRLDVCQA